MENFIKLLDILAWPVTVIFLALLFRIELKNAFSRLNKVKYGDMEASFGEQLAKVEKTTEFTKFMFGENTSPLRSAYHSKLERILKIAQDSPTNCIFEAWKELETAAVVLVRAYGLDANNVQLSKMFRGIVYESDFPWSLYEDYRRLMMLKNQVISIPDIKLDTLDAERYARTAIDLALFINKIANDVELNKKKD